MALTAVDICNDALLEIGQPAITSLSDTDRLSVACNRVYTQARDLLMSQHRWRFAIARNEQDFTKNLLSSTASWSLSGSGTNEYYLALSSTLYTTLVGKYVNSTPVNVYENGTAMTAGTLGSLAAGQWAFGNNDSLAGNTIYVRLSDSTDPDSKSADTSYLKYDYGTPLFEWSYAFGVPADNLRILELYNAVHTNWVLEGEYILYNANAIQIKYIKKVTDQGEFPDRFRRALAMRIAEQLAILITQDLQLADRMLGKAEAQIGEAKRQNLIESEEPYAKDPTPEVIRGRGSTNYDDLHDWLRTYTP